MNFSADKICCICSVSEYFKYVKSPIKPHIGTLINVDEKILVASVFVQTNRDIPKIFEWRTHVTNYKVVILRRF